MSYILDALKKNQLEQEGDPAALQAYHNHQRPRIPQWAMITLIVALAGNFLLFAWIFVLQPDSAGDTPQPAATPPPASIPNVAARPPETPVPATPLPAPQPAAPPVTSAPPPVTKAPQASPAPPSQPVNQTRQPVASPPPVVAQKPEAEKPAAAPTPPKPASPPLLQLRELSENEQTLYNGFNYTSHIFTDDPNECAVVVDGQRLQAGDGFKGLKVIRVTEDGVIFAENRRGRIRHVEVSIIEQWDRAAG